MNCPTCVHTLERLVALEAAVKRLERGGCACGEPEFYWAALLMAYRCGKCGALASQAVLPDELKPKELIR